MLARRWLRQEDCYKFQAGRDFTTSSLSQQSKKKPTALVVVVVEGVVSRPGPAQWSEPVRGLGTSEGLEARAIQLWPVGVGWVPAAQRPPCRSQLAPPAGVARRRPGASNAPAAVPGSGPAALMCGRPAPPAVVPWCRPRSQIDTHQAGSPGPLPVFQAPVLLLSSLGPASAPLASLEPGNPRVSGLGA